MEGNYSLVLRCHLCGQRQRDRRAYRDYLLWDHHAVARRGVETPTHLEGRELEAVWARIRRRHMTGVALAARRREEHGLPRVSEREAACRLHDNRARAARRLRAAARARGAASAALGTLIVPLAPPPMRRTRLGTFQVRPMATPAGIVGHGVARMPRLPCPRCTTCPCQTTRDFSTAQHTSSSPPRRPRSPIRPPSPRHLHTRSPKRDPSPGPPQLLREEPQPEKKEGQLSWADAQEQFSLGAEAMSQGSGSPLTFLETSTCDDILADIRQPDGTLPDFGSIPSEPRTPPPELKAAVAQGHKETQTYPQSTSDQSTQVLSRPHQETSSTQTPAPASTSDQGQQVTIRPPRSVAYTQTYCPATSSTSSYTQTYRPATSSTTSYTQTYRPATSNTDTGMPQILTTSTSCQAGSYFDNEVIPPGVPRPTLPWAYSYAKFDTLFTTYPDVYPEDFVTFGILQA